MNDWTTTPEADWATSDEVATRSYDNYLMAFVRPVTYTMAPVFGLPGPRDTRVMAFDVSVAAFDRTGGMTWEQELGREYLTDPLPSLTRAMEMADAWYENQRMDELRWEENSG